MPSSKKTLLCSNVIPTTTSFHYGRYVDPRACIVGSDSSNGPHVFDGREESRIHLDEGQGRRRNQRFSIQRRNFDHGSRGLAVSAEPYHVHGVSTSRIRSAGRTTIGRAWTHRQDVARGARFAAQKRDPIRAWTIASSSHPHRRFAFPIPHPSTGFDWNACFLSQGNLFGVDFSVSSRAFDRENLLHVTSACDEVRMATSTFPPPPRFYRLYAPGNSKHDAGTNGDAVRVHEGAARRPPDPPKPPEGAEFESFGLIYTLEDGLPPLRTDKVLFQVNEGRVDFKTELLRLNKALLYHFIDLIDTLATRPGDYTHALSDLEAVFQNTHYLLNAMRHFQARATLQHALQAQIDDHRQAIDDLRTTVQKHRSAVLRSLQSLSTFETSPDGMEVDATNDSNAPHPTTEGTSR